MEPSPPPPEPTPPTACRNVTASAVGPFAAHIEWTIPYSNGGAPIIDYALGCETSTDEVVGPYYVVGTAAHYSVLYTDNFPSAFNPAASLSPMTTYFCFVYAYNEAGYSPVAYSNNFTTR